MAFSYFPHTEDDIKLMLDRIGVNSMEELYSDVPEEFLFKGRYDLPDSMSELEVRRYFEDMASRNTPLSVFVGAGAYDHYSPAVIPYITSRSEFLTAYTPYQPEVSQGTLRYIFEFQSMVCELTGMDCSNASMYDGATSAAESAMMMVSCARKKTRILLSRTLLPNVLKVIETYCRFHGVPIGYVDAEDGQTSLPSLTVALGSGDVAGIIVPLTNRWGVIEDLSGMADAAHSAGALLSLYCDPSTLAVLKTPAEWGADIACGDCQSLGIPLCFGGPYVGFLACRKDYVRKLPGRIVGATRDVDGKRAFVLTLQAREQHIRREKATSNICSNQSLMALYVTVYLSLMGPDGLRRVNDLSYGGAHYLHDLLVSDGKFTDPFGKPFLKEFVLKPAEGIDVPALQQRLLDKGFFAAYQTEEGYLSFCVTEKRTKEEIDNLAHEILR